MLKRYVVLFMLVVGFSCLLAKAEPVIINDLGGLYLNKNVTEIEMRHANKAVQDYVIKESPKTVAETEVSKEESVVPEEPVSEYTFKKGKMDVSQKDNGEIEVRGVNNSKTIYTDDLGRLHFFGKGSITRD